MKCSKCNHVYDDQLGACPLCGEPRRRESGETYEQQRDAYHQQVVASASGQPVPPPQPQQKSWSSAADDQPPVPPDQLASAKSNATASLVCGILGMIIPFVGIVLAIIALVLGNSARKKLPETERGMATAGWILGIIGLVIQVIIIIFLIWSVTVAMYAGIYSAFNHPSWYGNSYWDYY